MNGRRPSPAGTSGRRGILRLVTICCAIGYPIALVGVLLSLRFVGERWWVTVVAMYLPRIGFGLPLPLVAVAAYFWAPRRYLAFQALSLAVLLFPLMGLNPGLGQVLTRAASPSVRLVSYNVGFGSRDVPAITRQVRECAPDLVLMQDANAVFERGVRAGFDGWHVQLDGEFIVASRYPIRETFVPPPLLYTQGTGGAHFVRYAIDTPLGLVDVFNVHTTSPRPGLEEVRGRGLREEIASGRLFAAKSARPVELNAYRRRRQMEALATAAVASPRPVIIAGDTNLPGLSWILNEYLGRFRDAFSQAGWGFGYTFPTNRPWMRIDRVLTNDRLRALDFRIGEGRSSDHRSVCAVIAADR
jgi:endonuclease/exonuclease/phosphatase (EEP) superfamily protein YafD